MHIPPYYKKESWQRFFVGTFIGAIISFIIFVYMYGQYHERWIEENLDLRAQLNDLQNRYDVLEEDKKALDEKSREHVTINQIEINITNAKKLKLDSLSVLQLEEMIKEQIKEVVGKNIENLSENYTLLISTIENKTYKVDDFNYSATVKHLFTTPTLIVDIEVQNSN